ncbi:hypothetical protein M569_02497, partial [Genlisea aurea]
QYEDALPLSHTRVGVTAGTTGIRRRLSSININPSAADWAVLRSKSVSDLGGFAGDSIRKWWEWGFGWILSRKPPLAADLEMNEEETAALGAHDKGSLRHILFKFASQLRRKFLGPGDVGLPHTFRPDS